MVISVTSVFKVAAVADDDKSHETGNKLGTRLERRRTFFILILSVRYSLLFLPGKLIYRAFLVICVRYNNQAQCRTDRVIGQIHVRDSTCARVPRLNIQEFAGQSPARKEDLIAKLCDSLLHGIDDS
jgi:hypothetical protein